MWFPSSRRYLRATSTATREDEHAVSIAIDTPPRLWWNETRPGTTENAASVANPVFEISRPQWSMLEIATSIPERFASSIIWTHLRVSFKARRCWTSIRRDSAWEIWKSSKSKKLVCGNKKDPKIDDVFHFGPSTKMSHLANGTWEIKSAASFWTSG